MNVITVVIMLVVVFIGIVFLGALISMYNGFIHLKNNITKSWSNIDVLLKQRSDELPNLIETVKGYVKHEKTLLTDLTKARANMGNAQTLSEKASASNGISTALKSLFAVAENYPDLKANQNFLKLQSRISELENQIADRREFFNDATTNYNIRLESFPDVLMGKAMGLTKKDLFEATGAEREVVNVKL